VFITSSIGISIYPEDGTEMQVLIKNSDMAVYRAKEKGRNQFEFFTDELNKKMTKKVNLETNLRMAIERNELQLHYQPIVDLATHSINGLEALLRWKHPILGWISPAEFIPVAEDVGLIVPIGKWIFQRVCLQNLQWQKEGDLPLDLRISINISARQFRENDLVETMTSLLKENEIDGQYYTLELTETLIMQDIEHSAKIIKALKDLGIHISIDDFGTGYSSLNYLKRFPIDILKIDRTFISDLTVSADDAAIVSAIIAMAHSLKMKVVAEGVETVQQYAFLKERNCDAIQGFLIAKPLPADEVVPFFQSNSSIEKMLLESELAQISQIDN
jgi:EAL domain-containing protein (putative c-di-GMP-specific phosphodiesterase class I)